MTREIEFFFDVASAYSYLASTQMAGLAERTGVSVRWRPFLLGGVFKATGNGTSMVPAKLQWMAKDIQLWATQYDVPVRVPSRFPLNSLRTQRALTAAVRLHGDGVVPAFAAALFRAAWVDDADVQADSVITACAHGARLGGAAIVGAIDAPETKDALRATTEEAVARGAFGAPAMFVGDALFWGNDRIALLEHYVAQAR